MLARLGNSVLTAVAGIEPGCAGYLPSILGDVAHMRRTPAQAAHTQACFRDVQRHTAGWAPAVSAADLQQLSGLLEQFAAYELIKRGPEGPALPALVGTALGALGALRTLGAAPDAAFLNRRTSDVLSLAGRPQEALPRQRAALRVARAGKGAAGARIPQSLRLACASRRHGLPDGHRCPPLTAAIPLHGWLPAAHLSIIASTLSLATLLMTGAAGPQWPQAEVAGLLAEGERALSLCKRWMPKQPAQYAANALAQQASWLRKAMAAQPGSTMLNSFGRLGMPAEASFVECCSGCGRPSVSLRKCSRCRAVAYCRQVRLLQLGAALLASRSPRLACLACITLHGRSTTRASLPFPCCPQQRVPEAPLERGRAPGRVRRAGGAHLRLAAHCPASSSALSLAAVRR